MQSIINKKSRVLAAIATLVCSIALSAPSAQAKPANKPSNVNAGVVKGNNGVIYGGNLTGTNGNATCAGGAYSGVGKGGCTNNFSNGNTSYNGNTQWDANAANQTFNRNVNRAGAYNGNTLNTTKNTALNGQTQTASQTTNRNGTYNGTDYNVDSSTNYSAGQVCRTVNGTYSTYTYTNAGKQLSCQ